MKYLVNRETKEHNIFDEREEWVFFPWQIVEADSEGWIPWNGGECPLPEGAAVVARYRCGEEFEGHALKVSDFATINAEERFWRNDCAHPYDIIAYRPILTEQSSPKADESIFDDVTVFDRLRTATEHAASIPAIIAEIDELLGAEWTVVRVEKVEAAAPQEDMSDWRNWKPGDLVECTNGEGWGYFGTGGKYTYCGVSGQNGQVSRRQVSNFPDNFRFHSRPTGAQK